LLAEAGYPKGFEVTMWVIVDREQYMKAAEAVQQDLSKVGIKVVLKPVAFAVWDEAVSRRKNVTMTFSGWYQDYPDPSNFLDVLLNGDRIVDVHCNNYAFYSNPQVNALLRAAAKETNRPRRLRLYQQAEALIVRDAPWAFLYHPTLYMLIQPYVKGHKMHPVWPNRFERLWIER
jgi:ABC-type transport system substrate-binding protein